MTTLNINKLPDEIMYEISLYIDCVKYRNGKYVYKISENDSRYKILKNIIPPINHFRIHCNVELRLHKIHLDNFDLNIYYYFNTFTKNTRIQIEKYLCGKFRGAFIKRISLEEYLINENGICNLCP